MDKNILPNLSSFLGGGWISVALSAILIGFLIWWSFKKHALKVKAATKRTLEEREQAEHEARRRSETQDKTDEDSRKDVDEFLGNSKDK